MAYKIYNNITGERDMTADEITAFNNIKPNASEKLENIREIRNQKLLETDWKITSAKEQGTNLSTSFKNWRQGLRDIPTTYTTESEYDELLARDEDGNLTHSVWSE